ncbi:hypothetical protein Agabi119p4_7045 [Agaricus bisporus var. burnettii]|uniref:Uncharacterized protein n=1 Tax=Agaricus bisporus var. burnettii TaxID=192524 RepID=A0A8H7F0P4_AGABI|nr:hypothetical protein Agabi119p4_7045 [Agaricus bisporus var. burnettii]
MVSRRYAVTSSLLPNVHLVQSFSGSYQLLLPAHHNIWSLLCACAVHLSSQATWSSLPRPVPPAHRGFSRLSERHAASDRSTLQTKTGYGTG